MPAKPTASPPMATRTAAMTAIGVERMGDRADAVVLTSPTYVGLINRVRLAGGVPRFIRLRPSDTGWRVELESIRAAVSKKARAFLMMSPSMPSGAVFERDEWAAICAACVKAN